MKPHASRGVFSGLMLLAIAGCTDMTGAGNADVLSELPGEIRMRTFGAAATTPSIEFVTPAENYTVKLIPPDNAVPVVVTFSTTVDAEIAGGIYKVAYFDNGDEIEPGSPQASTADITFNLGYGDHLLTLQLVDANGLPLITSQSGIQYVVTGGVLLVAASVDALSRRRSSASGR